jgi:signal transduction histidine kinase
MSRGASGDANAVLAEVVRLIAHDLANLFTCILAASSSPEASAQDVAAIHEAARTGTDLLRVVRDLGRREPGACRIDQVIAPCARLLSHVGRAKAIAVEIELGDAGQVALPGYELQELVLNLGLNAIAAGRDGGVLAIRTARRGDLVELVVRDDGAGMPDTTAPPAPGHSGLGLIAIRAIVDRAGGLLTLSTAPGGGTVVTIVLPAAA